LQYLVLLRTGYAPQMGDPALLLGAWETVGSWLGGTLNVVGGLSFFAVLFLLRAALRNTWRAVAVLVAILTAMTSLASAHLLIAITMAILWSTAAVALVRFGLIATVVGFMVAQAFQSIPYTLDFSTWYASHVFGVILSFIAMAAWGFYTSLGGRRLWSDELLE
jgi:hypothetical protein